MPLEVLDQYLGIVFRNPEPFNVETLQRVLPSRGFTIPAAPRTGLVISIGPPIIATGDDCRILYEPDVAILMSSSPSVARMLETFQALGELLDSELQLRWREMLRGIEFNLVARVTTESLPAEAISRFGSSLNLHRFSELFGEESSLFSLRLAPARASSSRENLKTASEFFELTIEPQVVNPLSYYCQLLYRNPDMTRTLEFARNAHETLSRAISAVEG